MSQVMKWMLKRYGLMMVFVCTRLCKVGEKTYQADVRQAASKRNLITCCDFNCDTSHPNWITMLISAADTCILCILLYECNLYYVCLRKLPRNGLWQHLMTTIFLGGPCSLFPREFLLIGIHEPLGSYCKSGERQLLSKNKSKNNNDKKRLHTFAYSPEELIQAPRAHCI